MPEHTTLPVSGTPPPDLPPGMPARTPRAPPHVSLRGPGLPSRPAVAVSGLGGASSGPRLVDHQLVGPLFDLTSERPRPSTMERTLYGPKIEKGKGSSDQKLDNGQPTTGKSLFPSIRRRLLAFLTSGVGIRFKLVKGEKRWPCCASKPSPHKVLTDVLSGAGVLHKIRDHNKGDHHKNSCREK